MPRASIRRETIISPGSLFHLPPLLHSSRVTLLHSSRVTLLHSSRVTLLPILPLKYGSRQQYQSTGLLYCVIPITYPLNLLPLLQSIATVLLLCAIFNIAFALPGTLQYLHYSSTRPVLKCTFPSFFLFVQVYHVLLSFVQSRNYANHLILIWDICALLKTYLFTDEQSCNIFWHYRTPSITLQRFCSTLH